MALRPECLWKSHFPAPQLPGATEGAWPFPVGTSGTHSHALLERGPQGGVLLCTCFCHLDPRASPSLSLRARRHQHGPQDLGTCPLVPLNFLMCLSSS